MDGTLITTASGRVFAKDRDDWKIGFPEVPGMLKQLANKEGFKVRENKLGLSSVRLKYKVWQHLVNTVGLVGAWSV